LHDFVELRGTGGEESIYICSSEAIISEVGEEELEQIPGVDPVKNVTVIPSAEAGKADEPDIESSETPHKGDESINQESKCASKPNVSDVCDDKNGAVSRGWWLLRVIGRFFFKLWTFILSPFKDGSIRLPDESWVGEVDDCEDEDDVQEAQTPANERTPLLEASPLTIAMRNADED